MNVKIISKYFDSLLERPRYEEKQDIHKFGCASCLVSTVAFAISKPNLIKRRYSCLSIIRIRSSGIDRKFNFTLDCVVLVYLKVRQDTLNYDIY